MPSLSVMTWLTVSFVGSAPTAINLQYMLSLDDVTTHDKFVYNLIRRVIGYISI